MAYEENGRQIAGQLRDRYGRLLEAQLGAPIRLIFERGFWDVPSNFIFKFGYHGSGPDCFHAFLQASGFSIAKSQVENAQAGDVFKVSGS